jgi:hypothetical protein
VDGRADWRTMMGAQPLPDEPPSIVTELPDDGSTWYAERHQHDEEAREKLAVAERAVELLARIHPAGRFILDAPESPDPLWGDGRDVLLPDGEALMFVGISGVGKTTLMQQLALGRCGFDRFSTLLGYPVQANAWGRTLYLAMDRPAQAVRSFRRMVTEKDRQLLDERMSIWKGPPLADFAKSPMLMVELARAAEAETVIVDSIKDAAVGLSDDAVGSGYNRCRQNALAQGVQVIEGHHNRKQPSGQKQTPSFDDIYGSTWIRDGVGSIIMLLGEPGDPIVRFHHLKQPAETVGPLTVVHDHDTGRSTIRDRIDLLDLVNASRGGLTALLAAQAYFETDKPSRAQKETMRRRLKKLAEQEAVDTKQNAAGDVWVPVNHTRPHHPELEF